MIVSNLPVTGEEAPINREGRETIGRHQPDVMAASKLDGNTVFSSDDNDVGKVKEIMLDTRTGRIAYVVLSSGGFLGMGDKLLAIPWHALTLDAQNNCFRLSMSSERIKNAPGFDKDNWPSMTDHAWAGSVHEFYGAEPCRDYEVLGEGDNLPGASDTFGNGPDIR